LAVSLSSSAQLFTAKPPILGKQCGTSPRCSLEEVKQRFAMFAILDRQDIQISFGDRLALSVLDFPKPLEIDLIVSLEKVQGALVSLASRLRARAAGVAQLFRDTGSCGSLRSSSLSQNLIDQAAQFKELSVPGVNSACLI
jgi:hypothetical protein